ncbi:MAG TPA: hypothetical protein VGW10_12420 [Solirubrobacteraceae bacterium]|nr:hypothetical protein [Solirubrobacteraceae bacterium]
MTPRLLAAVAAVLLLLVSAPAAIAQVEGPDAGQNEFFFHGEKVNGAFFDTAPPDSPTPMTQDTGPYANPDFPNNPLAAAWMHSEEDAASLSPDTVNGKQIVFRWYWSSPNATGVVAGIPASVSVFAIPEQGDGRVIGRETVEIVVGATPMINESLVLITGTLAAGERLLVQVVSTGLDTGPGLVAVYDSTDYPSGFSFRDPPPGTGDEDFEGVDGLASAPARGLAFSATLAADPQRDESEPNIEIDNDGNIYTCGPTGASQGADYAQVSRDGGNQFYLMGEPPRGQQAFGGGGDCGLATSPERNEQGNFTYSYTGLGPLTNFSTASSDDVGQTMKSSPSSQSVPGVDRQWQTFLDVDSVLLSYNQQAPRQVVIQRSDDGGVNYGPSIPATSTNPGFPGPMHHLPASANPEGEEAGRVPYFAFNRGRQVFLAMSVDEGASWHNCKVAEAPGTPALFPTADNDAEGNIYVAYSENTDFHAFMHVLPVGEVESCVAEGSEVSTVKGAQIESTEVQANVLPPIQIDRDAVRSSVFAWVTAGADPGRAAVTFYGSETNGNPNVGPSEDEEGNPTGFRGSWDVYVAQTLNALDANPDVAQVKATTHPFHYDSICLNGTACVLTLGDRSLADFFAIDFNPKNHSLHVVYNQGYKRPGDSAGVLATPAVVSQIAGPTLDGEPIEPAQGEPLASGRDDAEGDAITDYSHICLETDCPAKPAAGENQPGADLRSVTVGPQLDLADNNKEVPNGGFTVTMKVADLSDGALEQALVDQRATGLQFVFRWINGFRSSAAVARWNPAEGFVFGYNDFVVANFSCGSTNCLTYPGTQAIQGTVDQASGTIRLSVPRANLKGLVGSTGPDQRPEEKPAGDETRFYDGVAFVLASPVSNDTAEQGFLYPFDNTPSFDFLIGGKPPAKTETKAPDVVPVPDPAPAPSPAPAPAACQAFRRFRSASARGAGDGVRLAFTGVEPFTARGTDRVDVDVFRSSRGRRIVGPLLVARFRDRARSFTWDGEANRARRRVGYGWYFVRYRSGGDVRRLTLRRRDGKWTRRPSFHRRRSCRVLKLFKLSRPVFGGPTRRRLGIAYRLTEDATVRVRVMRGRRVVRRYAARRVEAGRIVRLRLGAKGLRRGDHRVIVQAAGSATVTASLTARRL